MEKIILHVLNTGSFSGAENVVITIIKEFKKQKIEGYKFIYVSLNGNIRKRLQEENIIFEPIKGVSVSEIKRIIKKCAPDIIHAHDFTASIICALAAGKIPVISHIHNNSPWIKKICKNSIAYGLSCIKYQYMFGVSGAVFKEFIFGNFFQNKEKILGNPINVKDIQEKAREAKEKEGYDIVFLGRLSIQKNPLAFLQIVSEVSKKIAVQVVMIGDGELREEVKSEIKKRGLNNIIDMKGFMNNPYGILQSSKLLCMPSKWEGYGLSAVEALSLGTPVICSRAGGLPGIVNNCCGKICDEKNEYIEEIVALLSDEIELKRKQEVALLRAKELDNIKSYVEGLHCMYGTILQHEL